MQNQPLGDDTIITMMRLLRNNRIKTVVFSAAIVSLLSACDQGSPVNLHQKSLPQPLSQAETLTSLAAGGCVAGGLRLYHGLDFNGDGKLGIYERHRQEIICNPSPLDTTSSNGVALSKPKTPLPEDG